MSPPGLKSGPSRPIWVSVFAAIALVLLAGDVWSYTRRMEAIRREQFQTLAVVGTLKSGQVQQWRTERLADARRLSRGPLVARAIAEFLREPDRQDRRTDLRRSLQPERMVDVYDAVLLLAPDGHVLFTTEDSSSLVDPATLRVCAAAVAGREAVLSDFFRPARDGIVRIDAGAAVRDEEGRPLTVVVLRSTADAFLYPLIQSWPTPSRSAETLLVQLDGEDVVFLNDLRRRSRTAPSVRVPLSRTTNVGVQAASGRRGAFEGRDHRDVDVLADLRSIPGSPWFMVTKVDADEVLTGARYRAGFTTVVGASFILLVTAAMGYLYRRRQAGIFRDLYDSERQQREAQETLRAILNSIGDAVISTDIKGHVRGMNPTAARLTGWTQTEALGQPLEKVFHVIDASTRVALDNPANSVLRDSGTIRLPFDTLLVARGGKERHIVETAAPIRDDRGTVSGVVLVFSDQTVQHAAGQALRESEQRLRTIIETEPECVKVVARTGELLEMNAAGLAMLEADSVAVVKQHTLVSFVLPEYRAAFDALHERVMGGGSGLLEFEITGLRGTRRWLETHAAPMRDAAGDVTMLLGVTRDISERKRAEEALRESEDRYRDLVENSRALICTHDLEGTLLSVNEAASKVTGYSVDVLLQMNISELLVPSARPFLSVYLTEIQATGHAHGTMRIQTASGEIRLWEYQTSLRTAGVPVPVVRSMAQDITERRLAERALRESLERFQLASRATFDVIWDFDTRTNTIWFNDNFQTVFGYAADDATLSLESWPSRVHPEDLERVRAGILAAYQSKGEFWSDEYRYRRKDGSYAVVENRGIITRDAAGLPVRSIGAMQDITERRHAEEALRVQAHMLNNVGQAVIATDPHGVITYANRFAEELYGWSSAEMMGRKILDLVDPQMSREQREQIMARLRHGENWSGELFLRRRDGVVFPVSVNEAPLLDKNGTLIGIIGISSDITERKRAEAAQRLQSAALNASVFPVMITDRNGTIEWANPAFTALTLYSVDEAVGKNPGALLKSGVHDRAFYEHLWKTILAGDVWRGEITNRRKDDSLYVEDMAITPVKDAGGAITHFIAIKRDLTKDKELQAQFLQSQKMEIVGQLAGGIAHDFNNLLTVINGTADLAAANVSADDPMLADLQEIQRAGARAASLTQQLLAFSRKQMMRRDVVNMGALAANLRDMAQRLIGEQINLVVARATDVGNVLADPGQMEQVIMNLVVNARDAMPTGGTLTVEARDVELDAAFVARHPSVQPGPHVMLAVSDTGAGMDEVTRQRIFEPFFTTKEPGRGTGLGLATAYGIVKQSGGSIWVDSAVGKGTTVTIYLPRLAAALLATQPARTLTTLSGTETILLVEDEHVLRRMAARILRSAGYTVLTAGHGVEALEVLERHEGPVHLLFTDVVLPGMNGRDLATRVSELSSETRILYTSGYTDDAILRHGVLDRATNFVGKPYTREGLTRKVREVLDSPGDRPTA